MVKKLSFFCAVWAEALDDVFGFFGNKTVGEGDGRYGYVGKTEGVVADTAGEVDVTAALTCVVMVTYASATAMILAISGISSPFSPSG